MKILSLLNVCLTVILTGFVLYNYNSGLRLAYVNNGELLNSFVLTKELENGIRNVESSKQLILDSLIREIELAGKGSDLELDRLKKIYVTKRNSFSEELQRIKQSSNEKIANQINQYVKEYGEDHDLDFIFGATNNANLWYSRQSNDITKDIIEYVNSKYNGKK